MITSSTFSVIKDDKNCIIYFSTRNQAEMYKEINQIDVEYKTKLSSTANKYYLVKSSYNSLLDNTLTKDLGR